MNVYIVALLATISLQANADGFSDIAGYDEVSIADESIDQTAIEDINDAVGTDDEPPVMHGTPEPEYDYGMSEMANKFSKKIHKMKKKAKKSKKIAKMKAKKRAKAKKRTLARF